MKKLNLKLNGKQMLTKEQMKSVSGGEWCTAHVVCRDDNWLSNNIGEFQAGVYCDFEHWESLDDECYWRFGTGRALWCQCVD